MIVHCRISIFLLFLLFYKIDSYPRDCLADVVFLIEESSLVSEAEYDRTKDIVRQTIQNLDVKENGVKIGVSCFSDTCRIMFEMDNFYSKSVVLNKVSELKRSANTGQPNVAMALNSTCGSMFSSTSGGRYRAGNFLVVLSSSQQSTGTESELKQALQMCVEYSVRIIGINGLSSHEDLMDEIAYNQNYHFEYETDDDLSAVPVTVSTLIFNDAGCKEVVDKWAIWRDKLVVISLVLVTLIMCFICFVQTRYLNRTKKQETEKDTKELKQTEKIYQTHI